MPWRSASGGSVPGNLLTAPLGVYRHAAAGAIRNQGGEVGLTADRVTRDTIHDADVSGGQVAIRFPPGATSGTWVYAELFFDVSTAPSVALVNDGSTALTLTESSDALDPAVGEDETVLAVYAAYLEFPGATSPAWHLLAVMNGTGVA